jgi:DNA primase
VALGNVELTPQLVQAVRDAVDIVDIASEHTRLTRKGSRWEGLCPLHKEKTPSFSVDRDRGLFYCFGCGAGGDAIKLHMQLAGDDFPAAIESLALRFGVPTAARGARRGPREGPDIAAALAAAAGFFADRLRRHDFPREYLERRRVPPELIERYGLGYAPDDWHALEQALAGTARREDLDAAGLVARSQKSGEFYDRFRHRLMFPIHNPSGRLVGFGGRALGDDPAKYINTAETERFHKGSLLYGLHHARKAIRDAGRALLVEGYFDALAAAAAGVDSAVASMGTALTPEQARLLARYAEEVVVGYDGDRAGEEAHRRALPLLLAQGLAVYRARLGEGHDPDSLRLAAGEAALARAVEQAPDAVSDEIERLTPKTARGEPRATAQAARALGDLLSSIPDQVLRYAYARRAAERLDVPIEVLSRRLRPAAGGRRTTAGGEERADGAGGAAPGAPRPPSPVRSAEEVVLRFLLSGAGAAPLAAELPLAEVFFDAECRNIYRVFVDLYGARGAPPDAREVLAGLGGEGAAVDRLAALLLEEPFGSEGEGLPEGLSRLTRRWQKQRQRELSREIHEAQRQGDNGRLERLRDEMSELSRRLHGG